MPYPEHEKLTKVKAESQAQGALLEWLNANGMTLCTWDDRLEEFYPAGRGIDALLAEFHGIDLDKIEAEKRAMLAELRAMSEASR